MTPARLRIFSDRARWHEQAARSPDVADQGSDLWSGRRAARTASGPTAASWCASLAAAARTVDPVKAPTVMHLQFLLRR